jgi:hypothetical protein
MTDGVIRWYLYPEDWWDISDQWRPKRRARSWIFCCYHPEDDAWIDEGQARGFTWAYEFTEYSDTQGDLPLTGESVWIASPWRRGWEDEIRAFIRGVMLTPYRGEQAEESDIDPYGLRGMGVSKQTIARVTAALGWQRIKPPERATDEVIDERNERETDLEKRRINEMNKLLREFGPPPPRREPLE